MGSVPGKVNSQSLKTYQQRVNKVKGCRYTQDVRSLVSREKWPYRGNLDNEGAADRWVYVCQRNAHTDMRYI